MKKLVILLFAVLAITVASPSFAQQECEGPPELCAQIIELKSAVGAQKELSKKQSEDSTAATEAAEKKRSEDMARMVGFAATIAILLKALLSALSGWKSYFKTDKGRAWLKIITVVVGFAAFIATNIGFGIPWWQALIVAGGGPGSILVHELMKLIPVIRGKAPLPADERDSSPSKPEDKNEEKETKSEEKAEEKDEKKETKAEEKSEEPKTEEKEKEKSDAKVEDK